MRKPSGPALPKNKLLTKDELLEHYHSRLSFDKTWSESLADWMTVKLGSVWFLVVNAFAFALWLLWNTGTLGLPPFDPPPFIMLTMVVSLEAIFLAVVVLISQNRQSKIADIRQKLDLEIDVRSEEEVTKILKMTEELHRHLGIHHKKDGELEEMKRKIDLEQLRRGVGEN